MWERDRREGGMVEAFFDVLIPHFLLGTGRERERGCQSKGSLPPTFFFSFLARLELERLAKLSLTRSRT